MKIKGPQINFTNCKITFEFELLTDIQKWKVKPNWWIHGISEQNTKKKKSTTCPRKRKINLTKQEKWLIHKLESRLVKYYMKTKYSILRKYFIIFSRKRVFENGSVFIVKILLFSRLQTTSKTDQTDSRPLSSVSSNASASLSSETRPLVRRSSQKRHFDVGRKSRSTQSPSFKRRFKRDIRWRCKTCAAGRPWNRHFFRRHFKFKCF
jgi:hypothetical protein